MFGLNHFKDNSLVQKILFTLFVVVVYRLGSHIPIPGVDGNALANFTDHKASGMLKTLNMFTGGALRKFSIFGLGVMPYISSSIVIQLMSAVLPSLEQLQKEGTVGRMKLNRISRILTVLFAFMQGFGFAKGLEYIGGGSQGSIVLNPGFGFHLQAALLLTVGSCIVMWLGEQITEYGLGNGVSLIIFAGIVSMIPSGLITMSQQISQNSGLMLSGIGFIALLLFMIYMVTFCETSYRNLPVLYAKRSYGGDSADTQEIPLPLKLNLSGMMAAIFASTVLAIPSTISSFRSISSPIMAEVAPGHWLYDTIFVLLVYFFSYFYISLVFKPDEIADNLKKQNAYMPGIRPGIATAEAIIYVTDRLTFIGALYVAVVVMLPQTLGSTFMQDFMLTGTSFLIMSGVGLDLINQIKSHLATENYKNFTL
jgi:preprotein translocase subunit SecY